MRNAILFSFLLFAHFAEASSPDPLRDREEFKAVADAVIEQHRITPSESLHSIINLRDDSEGRLFLIQYVDLSGNCTQETVFVYNRPNEDGSPRTQVTFFRQPRAKCE